jgi:hypothetical protein
VTVGDTADQAGRFSAAMMLAGKLSTQGLETSLSAGALASTTGRAAQCDS